MAIKFQPDTGSILLCEFNGTEPEMTKKRPVIVLSSVSTHLCLVVPLSTTEPDVQKPWHYLVNTPNPLPAPYDSKAHWMKGDMVCAVSFRRLTMPCKGKDKDGQRIYVKIKLNRDEMKAVRRCIASAIGITPLDFEE